MQEGERGAQRAGIVLVAFALVGIALFAVVARDRPNKLEPAVAAASDDETPAPSAAAPCGGAATVPAGVAVSPTGGFKTTPNAFDVRDVRVATSDPTWARFRATPKAGQEATFKAQSGVVQCTGFGWIVAAVGTGAGCSGTNPAPTAVRSELELDC